MKKPRDQQLLIRQRCQLTTKAQPPVHAKGAKAGSEFSSPTTPTQATSGMDPRLAAAVARGEAVRQQLAADEGGSISSGEAARLLRISKVTALRRWHNHRLVGWKQGKAIRFPVWQFDRGQVLEGIESILQILHSNDHWRVMLYFLSKRLSLRNRRPLDLLRQGKAAQVIRHAHLYAEDNTW